MGRAANIVEICGRLMESVLGSKNVTKANAIIDLDREYDGWCFDITFRRSDDAKLKPSKSVKKRSRPDPQLTNKGENK